MKREKKKRFPTFYSQNLVTLAFLKSASTEPQSNFFLQLAEIPESNIADITLESFGA